MREAVEDMEGGGKSLEQARCRKLGVIIPAAHMSLRLAKYRCSGRCTPALSSP